MTLSSRTRKLLWGRAANRCAICRTELSDRPPAGSRTTVLGEECHIVAKGHDGPRAGDDPPGGEMDGYDNLILLCPTHHTYVDDQPEAYTVSRLVQAKADHEQWVAERLSGDPAASPDRADMLRRLYNESLGRCIERWQAVGVPRQVATQLAEDRSIGRSGVDRIQRRPLTVLVGDVGTGKSLLSERIHQDAVQTALATETALAPVWLRAVDIESRLDEALQNELDALESGKRGVGFALTVDGLDEVGPNGALAILAAARRLVGSTPGSRAVLTSRLLDGVGNDDERQTVEPLPVNEAEELVGRLAERDRFSLFGWPPSVRDAVQRPFFALALAAALRSNPEFSPSSPAEIIDRLARSALGPDWGALREPLVQLGVESLRRDGASVSASEIVPAHTLDALLRSRIVVDDRGRLRFPLVIYAQWFAAQALIEGDFEVNELIDEATTLDRWRYPLAVAVASGPAARATGILGVLAQRAPAYGSIVLSEAARQYGTGAQDLGTWQQAAAAVREAELSWAKGLGDLASLVVPGRGDVLPPLGALVDGDRLTTAWYQGPEQRDAVFELPSDFFVLDAGLGYGPARSSTPPDGPAWAWRWTRDEISNSLGRFLKDRRLLLTGSAIEHELVWTTVLRALGHGSLTPGPVDASQLLDMDSRTDAFVRPTGFFPAVTEVSGLTPVLERYVDGDGFLHSPWPQPDLETGSGWVWGDFSPEQIRRRAEAIYGAALEAYAELMVGPFSVLANRMQLAVTLPAVARGTVSYAGGPELHDGPAIEWWLDPSESGPPSASFELNAPRQSETAFQAIHDRLIAQRPEAASWISAVLQREILEIFNEAPAERLLYSWLWSDLEGVDWVKGLHSSRDYGSVPRFK